MNNGYPYGQFNNNSPYQGGYYPYPPKKSFSERIKEDIKKDSVKDLMKLGLLGGFAILLHIVIARLVSSVVVRNPALYELFRGNSPGSMVFDGLYSFIAVGLPFLLVYIVIKKAGLYKETMPFGLHYDNSDPLLLILAGLGFCYLGDILSSYMVQFFNNAGIEFYSYDYLNEMQSDVPDNIGILILSVLRIAVIPALIEEFAFRGVIMQPLRKYGDWFAIITSAVLFGVLHGNFMQIPFAMIAGIALGYVNVVSGTMWVNIALHLLNNLLSLLYSMLLDGTGDMAKMLLSAVLIYGMIIIGGFAFIIYSRRHRNFTHLYKNRFNDFKGRTKYYFLMPTVVVALAMLMWQALTDIKGFII